MRKDLVALPTHEISILPSPKSQSRTRSFPRREQFNFGLPFIDGKQLTHAFMSGKVLDSSSCEDISLVMK